MMSFAVTIFFLVGVMDTLVSWAQDYLSFMEDAQNMVSLGGWMKGRQKEYIEIWV